MLQLKGLSLRVQNEDSTVEILKDISLTLKEKGLYVITGPNGGGKSSLAKVIMGIHKPVSGKIIFDDQDITELDITQRARIGIGYAFQQPPRFKGIKVRELLKLASGSDRKIDLCDLLYDVGLCAEEYLEREVDSSLSGGELKRIEIATVICRNLKLAVFDEPEAGIDLWSFQKLGETFKNIHMKYDTTIVIISHQERILNLADEVILMVNGTVREITDKDKILSDIVTNEVNCRCRQECDKGVGKIAGHIG